LQDPRRQIGLDAEAQRPRRAFGADGNGSFRRERRACLDCLGHDGVGVGGAATPPLSCRAAATSASTVHEPTRLTVDGDRLRLEQALSNLVDNALRHGRGSVRLRARARGDTVELHVTDQGEGVPEAFALRAFEPFARDRSTRGEGSGLGLAIVEAVARAHGGTAQIRSLDQGTDAWIALPRCGRGHDRACEPDERAGADVDRGAHPDPDRGDGDTTLNPVSIDRVAEGGGANEILGVEGAVLDRVVVPPPELVHGLRDEPTS
jgi:hypothetical protein